MAKKDATQEPGLGEPGITLPVTESGKEALGLPTDSEKLDLILAKLEKLETDFKTFKMNFQHSMTLYSQGNVIATR